MPWTSDMQFRDCPWCGLRDAQMRVLAGPVQASGPDDVRIWTFVSCPRCAGAISLEVHDFLDAVLTQVPQRESVPFSHLPEDVEEFYRGALRVLGAGVPDAAAVQLRRTLEAAAAHFDVTQGPLVQRIEALIERGLITAEFGRVLHHIRQVGNVGAHATDERVDEEAATRALRFTTQVLVNLFEIPAELSAIDSPADENGT